MTDVAGVPRLTPPITDRDHARGSAAARVTLTMFGDYECPYTRRAHRAIEEIRPRLVDRLRVVYRTFPLTEIHSYALHAALAAEAADAQGRFWEMHDHLFAHQKALGDDDLHRYAAALGPDADWLAADIAAGTGGDRIAEDATSGEWSGVEGTPTRFVDGLRHEDNYYAETLLAGIESAAGTARG